MGSTAPVLAVPPVFKGSAPKAITCLSISLTKTVKALVGQRLAPARSAKATALLLNPEDSSQ